MDYNWLFSAIAQSMAAIVGLIGAFLISKIIKEKNEFEADKNKINLLYFEALSIKHQVANTIVERGELIIKPENRKRIIDLLNDGWESGTLFEKNGEINRTTIIQLSKVVIRKEYIYNYIDFDTLINILEQAARLIQNIKNNPDYDNNKLFEGYTCNDKKRDKMNSIDQQYAKLKTIQQKNKDAGHKYLNKEKTWSLNNIVTMTLLSMALIFLLGVIWPLGLLPIKKGCTPHITILPLTNFFDQLSSVKGILLFLTTLIFSFFIYVVYRINKKMKLPKLEKNRYNYINTTSHFKKEFAFKERNTEIAWIDVEGSHHI